MTSSLSRCRPVVAAMVFICAQGAGAGELDEVLVTARLRATPLQELAQSVTVIDQDQLRTAGVQHLEDLLGAIPDLNWAAGTSRPRYFQIRGIGEVEQYQGAPNPSVGFLIDDIDFSGVGMPATLFDTDRVEVLRGPQGTAYGANALAGLISVRTRAPGRSFEVGGEATGATYNTRSLGAYVGDGSDAGGWRLVAQRYRSDGFRHNAYLGRYDTNGYDEATVRARGQWRPSSAVAVDVSLLYVDLDNGYDAWSPYNTYTTYSNQPGRDAQRSSGASVRVAATVPGVGELTSVTSGADSAIVYSFDGDWGNDTLWGAYAPYDYFQIDRRTRRTLAQDLRLAGVPGTLGAGRVSWLAGLYAMRLTERDDLAYQYNDQFNGQGTSLLSSHYVADTLALYGSANAVAGSDEFDAGLRIEQRRARYADSSDVAAPFPAQSNRMVGGHLSWTHRTRRGDHVYATLSRGYKGGGFNIGSQILSEQRGFGPEALWSAEAGIKRSSPDGVLELQTDLFYMRRQHQQVYLSEQLQTGNPLAYVFYTQNASDGENYGWEVEGRLRWAARWRLSAGASALRTRFVGVTGPYSALGIDGRAQPFAPGYKASVAVDYGDAAGWYVHLDSSAVGSFYYYTSDAQTSAAYHLESLRVGYRRAGLEASLWVRNVLDRRYAQQGFYFGLIPPDFRNQSFLQPGDPRQIGVTIRYAVGAGGG